LRVRRLADVMRGVRGYDVGAEVAILQVGGG
jgi:hypothetical protein